MSWPTLSSAQADVVASVMRGDVRLARPDLCVVTTIGKHRGRFLHSLLTVAVDAEAIGARRRACLCTAQGRVTAIVHVMVQPDAIAMIVARNRAQALIDGLLKFRVGERVKLAIDDSATVVHDHRGLQIADDGGHTDAHVADALRIQHGVPRLGDGDAPSDVDDGSTPLELGLWDAVDFDKGCYLGQEAIAMLAYRGKLRRHLCWVEPVDDDIPAAAMALRTEGGRRAGMLGTGFVAGDKRLGLALVQRKAFAKGAILLAESADGGPPARVRVFDTTIPDAFDRDPSEYRKEVAGGRQ